MLPTAGMSLLIMTKLLKEVRKMLDNHLVLKIMQLIFKAQHRIKGTRNANKYAERQE